MTRLIHFMLCILFCKAAVAQPKFLLRILEPGIEITKLEPAQPMEGEMQKVFFTFTNWAFRTIATGTIGGSFAGVRSDPANTRVTITNLAHKQSVSDVILLKTPAAGESTLISLIYYEGEVVKKLGFRKKPVARAEVDVEIAQVFVTKRISGRSFFTPQNRDSRDRIVDNDNGLMTVFHSPGCGVVGNDGTDKFFVNRGLPQGVTIISKEFNQYWPSERGCGDPWSWANDGGSYDATFNKFSNSVRWHNSCTGGFNSKETVYTMSFIISLPRGMDIGEKLYDAVNVLFIPPAGYQRSEPQTPAYCSEYRNIGFANVANPQPFGPFHEPSILRQKLPFTIRYEIKNIGGAESEEFDVTLFIDNVSEPTKTVKKLKVNESTVLTWDITKELTAFVHSFELKFANGGSYSHAQLTFEK